MENDGFTPDDKRTPIEGSNIDDILAKYPNREESSKSFNVTYDELKENEYNLLPSRYKKIEYVAPTFEHTPQEYVQLMIEAEKKSLALLEKLQEKIGGINE